MIKKRKEAFTGLLLVAPFYLLLVLTSFYPIFKTFGISLTEWDGLSSDGFIGLDNYKEAINDPMLYDALFNTLRMVVLVVPITIILSLLIATALNGNIRGKKAYTTAYYLPVLTMSIAIAVVFQYMFAPDFGIINNVLGKFGIDTIYWIDDPRYSWIVVSIITIWKTIGVNLLLFLAALQGISSDVYEAADLDGFSKTKKFFRITVPLVSPTIFFVSVMNTISVLQTFDTVFVLTDESSPGIDSVRTLVYYFYTTTFTEFNRGYGSAIAIIIMIIVAIFTAIQFMFEKKYVHYE